MPNPEHDLTTDRPDPTAIDVLLIEDNPGDVALIQHLLRGGRTRFAERVATTLAEGLAALRERRPSLVICDLGLPDSQGMDTFCALERVCSDIPIVVLSGLDDERFAVSAVQAGAQDYLVKGHISSQDLARCAQYAIERKRIDERLRESSAHLAESQAQLQTLSEHWLRVRENEQRRLAREMHDELGQLIAVLKMDALWVRRRLTPELHQAAERMDAMLEHIEMLLKSIKVIGARLRPGMLDSLGLVAALEHLVGNFRASSGIDVELIVKPSEVSASSDAATGLYRVVQEALTNIAKHASASNVRVSLHKQDTCLALEVADDGVGFDVMPRATAGCYGLLGIQERIRALGGRSEVASAAGEGTRVRATIPLCEDLDLPQAQRQANADTDVNKTW